MYHQVGDRKAEKPQALKLGSEKALVMAGLKVVSLSIPASNRSRYMCWYCPVEYSLEMMYYEQHVCWRTLVYWTPISRGQCLHSVSVYMYVNIHTIFISIYNFCILKRARADGERRVRDLSPLFILNSE